MSNAKYTSDIIIVNPIMIPLIEFKFYAAKGIADLFLHKDTSNHLKLCIILNLDTLKVRMPNSSTRFCILLSQ